MLGADASAADFTGMNIPVKLYKVADVNTSGVFQSTETFKDINYNVSMDANTNAATWEALAEKTMEKLNASQEKPFVEAEITGGADAVIEGLDTGMYLVAPQDTLNADFSMKYVFTPYLTALPSSEYTLTGAGSDEWIYDRTINLKGEAEPQFGKLTIYKTLANYNATLGKTTCVFLIEGKDAQGNIPYSDVVSITLNGPETQSVTVENLPAGLNITVTEIYSGASYEIVGENVKNTTIVSDAGVDAGRDQASVSFSNQYDGGNRGGYGVTNAFTVSEDGEWEWTDPTSPNTPPAN